MTAREMTMPAPADRPLEDAKEDQRADMLRQRATHRSKRKDEQPREYHRATAEAVG
jgi:hypothetical protein